ncbi:sensor histidine kinase [Occultella aeris]|uniref:histidine kinase n=1 Tax=Occultella aeris TaxID=2761496 RepID=A0A7M4DHV0_9MICO|nr:histidine kinase [Occultella aeris]VZO36497.1 Sensor histidine kinase DesK [Occultella aeris]
MSTGRWDAEPERGRLDLWWDGGGTVVAMTSMEQARPEAQPPPGREVGPARRLVPVLAVAFALLAVIADAGDWRNGLFLLLPVAAFAAWYRWDVSIPVLAAPVIVGTAGALWGGDFEPALFLLALFALVSVAWCEHRPTAWALVALSVVAVLALALGRPEAEVAWAPWVVGISFPAVLGWVVRRQEQTTAQLTRARRELAERAVQDERRRIARDLHDLVGHGLAAVLLQVTSARHVLRRDVDSADDALATAERVGRASMQDLRATMDLLRADGEPSGNAPLPGLAQLPVLVAGYAERGLDVALEDGTDGSDGTGAPGETDAPDGTGAPGGTAASGRTAAPGATGAPARTGATTATGAPGPGSAVGLTLYRIAQEALANAATHAPDARTRVRTAVGPDSVMMEVVTEGPLRPVPPRPVHGHYGLLGMRERAEVIGADLQAGPTPAGWTVRCEVPIGGAP